MVAQGNRTGCPGSSVSIRDSLVDALSLRSGLCQGQRVCPCMVLIGVVRG